MFAALVRPTLDRNDAADARLLTGRREEGRMIKPPGID